MRIWDIRRGDHDDNRTSPHGRGLRGLLLSAALEFDYLKALIGFLALIIGPALLVGIVPSVLVTYGRLKFDAAASAGNSPIVVLIIVAVLVGSALWIGRPLLATAVENFWNLDYTLVFPIFVAFREFLRSVAERFPGQTATRETAPSQTPTPHGRRYIAASRRGATREKYRSRFVACLTCVPKARLFGRFCL